MHLNTQCSTLAAISVHCLLNRRSRNRNSSVLFLCYFYVIFQSAVPMPKLFQCATSMLFSMRISHAVPMPLRLACCYSLSLWNAQSACCSPVRRWKICGHCQLRSTTLPGRWWFTSAVSLRLQRIAAISFYSFGSSESELLEKNLQKNFFRRTFVRAL